MEGRALVIIDWANVYGWFSRPKSKSYLGWEIDPKRLFDYLSIYDKIFDKRIYYGVEAGNKRSEDFYTKVQSFGFNFIKKDVKWAPVYLNEESHFEKIVQGLFDVIEKTKVSDLEISTKLYELISQPYRRRKCDFDVEIVRDVFNMSDKFDSLVLFSGDGDYSALAENLISKGKKVIVVFAYGHMGEEYNKLKESLMQKRLKNKLFLCSANHLKADICLKTITPQISPRGDNIPTDCSAGRDISNIADSA